MKGPAAMIRRRRRHRAAAVGILAAIAVSTALGAQDGPIFFREDWTETPAAQPITQGHVSNSDLVLTLHGPGGARMKKSHHDQPADDPFYVWSGEADGPWAVTLRHRHR